MKARALWSWSPLECKIHEVRNQGLLTYITNAENSPGMKMMLHKPLQVNWTYKIQGNWAKEVNREVVFWKKKIKSRLMERDTKLRTGRKKERMCSWSGSILGEGTKVDYSKPQEEKGKSGGRWPVRAKKLIGTKVKIFFIGWLREPIVILKKCLF